MAGRRPIPSLSVPAPIRVEEPGVQNGDGSWTGHHCITGRTFCTAAALLVLMSDRAPAPTASRLQHG